MKKKSSEKKKNRRDIEFEKKVMEMILNGGTLDNITDLIHRFYKGNWKQILSQKVKMISGFWTGNLIFFN